MKSEINNYSQLLVEEIRGGTEVHSAVSKLKKLLKQRRQETILGAVLQRALRHVEESRDYAAPTLVVANDKDAKKYAKVIGQRSEPLVVIDPELIGGYVASENYVMEDASYRSKLIGWYRRATKN